MHQYCIVKTIIVIGHGSRYLSGKVKIYVVNNSLFIHFVEAAMFGVSAHLFRAYPLFLEIVSREARSIGRWSRPIGRKRPIGRLVVGHWSKKTYRSFGRWSLVEKDL